MEKDKEREIIFSANRLWEYCAKKSYKHRHNRSFPKEALTASVSERIAEYFSFGHAMVLEAVETSKSNEEKQSGTDLVIFFEYQFSSGKCYRAGSLLQSKLASSVDEVKDIPRLKSQVELMQKITHESHIFLVGDRFETIYSNSVMAAENSYLFQLYPMPIACYISEVAMGLRGDRSFTSVSSGNLRSLIVEQGRKIMIVVIFSGSLESDLDYRRKAEVIEDTIRRDLGEEVMVEVVGQWGKGESLMRRPSRDSRDDEWSPSR